MKSLEEIKEMYTELAKAIQERAEADKNDVSIFSIACFDDKNLSMVIGNNNIIGESITYAITKMSVDANIAVLGAVITGCANHPDMKHQMPAILEGLSEFIKDIISRD